ncbi:hypothetical protein EV356DRAFT_519177 [Viridothelium virens]|uniref:Uncharacterized protein n=1 Tax=Viridothelium virens TaxID=1048519 RepID=A0A6A6GZ76_VIRVR|nr:hypothetical protein EV356DRAFT_519177 [Viridothelium virens]
MPAPIAAKGIIIAATVLVAAGVAIYETNPQLRAWLEESRRKIALALQNLGPDSQNASRRNQENEEDRERRQWFEEGLEAEMRRQGWNGEVFQRPGMEGVNMELRRRRARGPTSSRSASQSFDNLLSEDGSLRREHHAATSSSSGSKGFERGAAAANPFSDEFEVTDEKSQMLFDQDLIGADQDDVLEHEKEAIIGRSRESTATLRGDEKQEALIDVSEGPSQPQPSGAKAFFDSMLQSIIPAAKAPNEEDEFERQMRNAIEASLQDTHSDSSMLNADEDADLKAAIAASLQDAKSSEESTSKGKAPEAEKTHDPQPLASLSQPNPWSELSASSASFHSAHGALDSYTVSTPTASQPSDTAPISDSRFPEMSQSTHHALTLPIPPTHTGETEDLYSLTPAGAEAQTPTSASFITSPSDSRPSTPALSEPFSTFTPSEPEDAVPLAHPNQYQQSMSQVVTAISPLGERSEADAMERREEEMSEVSGWSEVEGASGIETPGDWTDVESEAEGMSEDGEQVHGRAGQQGAQARL